MFVVAERVDTMPDKYMSPAAINLVKRWSAIRRRPMATLKCKLTWIWSATG